MLIILTDKQSVYVKNKENSITEIRFLETGRIIVMNSPVSIAMIEEIK